jgi:hypothetical protein
MFVAVGQAGTIITSPDRINWTAQTNKNVILKRIIYENDVFVIEGYGGTLITSLDGTNFTLKASGTNKNLWGIITYDTNKLIVVGTQVILLCKPYKEISVIPDV